MSVISNLATLSSFHTSSQDVILSPLANYLQLAAFLRGLYIGEADNVVRGLGAISQHINSSRFILRFLTGVNNLHALITEPPKDSSLITVIRTIQRVLNIGYNLAELPAYVAMVAPMMTAGSYNGDAYGRVSCMFWLANVVLESIVFYKQKADMSRGTLQWGAAALVSDALLASNWSLAPKNQFLSQSNILLLNVLSSTIVLVKNWKAKSAELKGKKVKGE